MESSCHKNNQLCGNMRGHGHIGHWLCLTYPWSLTFFEGGWYHWITIVLGTTRHVTAQRFMCDCRQHKFKQLTGFFFIWTLNAASGDHAPNGRTVVIFSTYGIAVTVANRKRMITRYLDLLLFTITPCAFADALITLYGNWQSHWM